jgi:lipopolysaccharide export system protein LptC
MSVELHLPDLPEVPISLGPVRGATPRPELPWHLRLRDALSSYLPLLLMALLALATWWLAKHAPRAPGAPTQRTVSAEPDYTMNEFALERFAADGRLKIRIEGARMRHYPDTDRIEIDDVEIHAYAEDGRVSHARARRALGNGDGSEIQLLGGAEVSSPGAEGGDVVIRGEFLHAFTVLERVRSHLPVMVRQGASEMTAAGLEYDHATGRLELKGPLRAELAAPAARKAAPR